MIRLCSDGVRRPCAGCSVSCFWPQIQIDEARGNIAVHGIAIGPVGDAEIATMTTGPRAATIDEQGLFASTACLPASAGARARHGRHSCHGVDQDVVRHMTKGAASVGASNP